MRLLQRAVASSVVRLVAVLIALTAGIVVLAGSFRQNDLEITPQLGGAATIVNASRNSFGLPAPSLSYDDRLLFEIGDSFFTQNWVTAPASTEARDGLGPTFNAMACSSCHLLDGRGEPPDPSGRESKLGLLLRLSEADGTTVTGAPAPIDGYGNQLQDRAILGVPAEGKLALSYAYIHGEYGDGVSFELRKPHFEVTETAFGPLPDSTLLGPRLAPQVIGMGLLEALATEDVLAIADPYDRDGDGISGRANFVWSESENGKRMGRFGWKANTATVEDQVTRAFHGDIGITSSLQPDENCPGPQRECRTAPNGGAPELTESLLEAIAFYIRTLAVPAMRNLEDPQVRTGAKLFKTFGCTSCHATALTTSLSGISALSEQLIHPFTDLLLHDMGPELADGRPDFEASGSEWRTPPLWGLGLIDDINGARFLLHDGRARTIEEAILWHGGEAEAAKEKFRLAELSDRQALVAFLESL